MNNDLYKEPEIPDFQEPDLSDILDRIPDIDASLSAPPKNPLDAVDSQENIEADSLAEMEIIRSEKQEADKPRTEFQIADARVEAHRQMIFDYEFWVAVCFQSREQKEAFLKAIKEPRDKYIDGRKLAKRMGIELPDDRAIQKPLRVNKNLSALAMGL